QELDLQRAARYDNVANILDAWVQDCSITIVMELADGSLRDVIVTEREKDLDYAFPEPQILEWATQLAQALKYLHGIGVIHRNLKPENVLLFRATLKLANFGLCRTMSPGPRIASVYILRNPGLHGSGGDFRNASADGRGRPADSWASGITIAELMTRKHPFAGPNGQCALNILLTQEPAPPPFQLRRSAAQLRDGV
ncbi:Serine/threonine-protein kinase stk11, partial [Tilletia horrida]